MFDKLWYCFEVHRSFTGGVSMQWTVLERTCRKTYYWHLVKRMPTCICAWKSFVQVRIHFLFTRLILRWTLTLRACLTFSAPFWGCISTTAIYCVSEYLTFQALLNSDTLWHKCTLINFLSYVYFRFLILHFIAVKNELYHWHICRGFKSKKIKVIFLYFA